jgi:hypothetical protein
VRTRRECGSLRLIDRRRNQVESHREGETALTRGTDANTRGHARAASVMWSPVVFAIASPLTFQFAITTQGTRRFQRVP